MVKAKIVNEDGTPLSPAEYIPPETLVGADEDPSAKPGVPVLNRDAAVGPVNLWLYSLFSQVR